jgi:hypothetical protein
VGFRLKGLPSSLFSHLADLSDAELKAQNIIRIPAEPGFPCRITLRDVEIGAPALLLHHFHHDVATSPYRSSGPIFVSEGQHQTADIDNEIPTEMRGRLYSARSYDSNGFMVDGKTAPGTELESLLDDMLNAERVEFVHLHHALRGCFACRVERS